MSSGGGAGGVRGDRPPDVIAALERAKRIEAAARDIAANAQPVREGTQGAVIGWMLGSRELIEALRAALDEAR